MDQSPSTLRGRRTAATIARRLTRAADRLEQARTAVDFAAALDSNRRLWRALRRLAPRIGDRISDRLLASALSAAITPGPDDHAIALLIGLDRRASASLNLPRIGSEQ